MPRASVIVSTYNQPHYLELTLWSYALQGERRFELIVADDGSTGDTRDLVHRFAGETDLPVRHVWQEDRGFRKAEILNKAVRASSSGYLIFTDGDCIAHPRFVASHLRHAQPRTYLVGRTPRLGRRLSARVTLPAVRSGRAQRLTLDKMLDGLFGESRKMEFGFYLGSDLLFERVRKTKKNLELWGGNFSCHRADFVAVNGFNEDFVGWGKEDLDLGVRLRNFGLRPFSITNRAVNFHLWHGAPPDKKTNVQWQTETKEKYRRTGEYYCPHGLDGHE